MVTKEEIKKRGDKVKGRTEEEEEKSRRKTRERIQER